jgi:hypothetical protein
MREVWAEIRGFPNYQVSNYGVIRSLRTRSLIQHRYNGGGYAHVTLSTYGEQHEYYVHQLVAQAFFDNYEPGMRLKHVNGDQSDCSVPNLQLRRRREHLQHSRKETHAVWGKSVRIVETGEVFRTVRQCARFIGGDYSAIYGVLRGQRAVHLGYTFEYVEGES